MVDSTTREYLLKISAILIFTQFWITLFKIQYLDRVDSIEVVEDPKLNEPSDALKSLIKALKVTCKQVKKVGYLESQKCGSSPLQNIILRFAMLNDLNVVMPEDGGYFDRMKPFSQDLLQNTTWQQARLKMSIFCQNTIWDHNEMTNVLGSEAQHVSMIRDPIDTFVHLWDCAKLGKTLNLTLSEYVTREIKKTAGNLGKKMILSDFGLDKKYLESEEDVQTKIEDVDANFNLIMIAERFEESLVLLKDHFCWEFEDVKYLNFTLVPIKTNISSETRSKLEILLKADYLFYNHFSQKFDDQVLQFGEENMKSNLATLNEFNERLYEECGGAMKESFEKSRSPLQKKLRDDKMYAKGHAFHRHCLLYSMHELTFLELLRQSQMERAKAKLHTFGQPKSN